MKLTPTIVILGIVVVVIVVLVIVFALIGRQTTQPAITETTPITEVAPQIANLVEVSAQSATNSATIDLASFTEGGYVVIHEEEDGQPGAVIGNSEYLTAGVYQNLQVVLTRTATVGENLFAMLHNDDGDKTYGFPDEDLPLRDDAGNIILQKFQVTE